MSLPDYKSLKKLADICRKAGIKSFKNADCEFTLTDEAPVSAYKKRTAKKQSGVTETTEPYLIETDELTQDQLLLWSSGVAPGESSESQ